MRKQFIIILLALLAIFGLMVSCKNEVPNAGFGEELVSVSFKEDMARGLTATLEGFDKDHLYWAYAAKKADGSQLISGETDSYDVSGAVWVKTDGYNKPVEGLGSTGTSGYEAYKVSGFSQGYWNFKLYAYKGVLGDNPATEAVETDYVTDYVLVYQGETLNALLKSDSVNAQGSHMVSVTVDPVQSEGNGTMVFLTNNSHLPADRISMNTVNSAIYGTNYTVKVLSILSMEDFPVEYVDAAGAKIHEATDSQDGEYTLPAGSYKVTVAFTDSASAPTLNYAKGTIVATVYSNLTTTISGDLTEAMTYAEFDGILNPDLVTVTAVSAGIPYDKDEPETKQVVFSSTGTAKAVTATTTREVTNQIIEGIAATNGTSTGYNQSLKLTLSVETVESTETTATYEIGMSATLTSTKTGVEPVVTTSDVSEVDKHVTVVIQLQPGLEDVNVLHDGHQMAKYPATDAGYGVFSYNTDNGELTIITKSFSPFTVSFVLPAEDYVAQVGNLKYLTLSGAIANASDNATVTLLKNVGETVDFNIYAGILDLAGYKITGNVTASKYGATVRNGSITGTLSATGNSALIKDLTVTGKISVGGTGAKLENCTVTGTGDSAVEVATDGNATIKSGTYKAADNQKILNGSIFVEDGNFKGTLTESASVSLVGGVYEYDVKDYVVDGYKCAKVSEGVYKVRKIVEARNVTTKTDYYFLQDAIDASSAGDVIEILININAEKTITVPAEKELTIRLGETTELQTFIPHTITTNAKLGLVNNGSLTIDGTGSLINCYKVEGTYNDETNYPLAIENNGSLILDGCIVGCEYGRVVDNYGTLTIKNNAELKAKNLTENNGWGDFLIHSVHGTVIVNSIVINNTTTAKGVFQITDGSTLTVENATIDIVCSCYLVDLRNGSNGKSTATIKNGTFKTTMKYYASGKLSDVSQQMFTFKDKVSSVDGSVLTIDGGTFKFNNSYCYTQGSTNYCPEYVTFQNVSSTSNLSTLVVNGGTFESIGKKDSETLLPTHLYYNLSSGSINVILSVGTFDVSADSYEGGLYPAYVLAPGSKKVFEDNRLVVSKIPESEGVVSVERVNAAPVYFLNFEDAVKYVESGDTINILKDCTASYHGDNKYDFSGKDITIHVNEGKTLSCGDVTKGKFVIGWSNAAGTLTLEGPGAITFNSNYTWGLITQNGSGSDIKAIVRNVTIEASSENGRVASSTGVNLTVESGNFKNIVFDNGTAINRGYFTTDVSNCIIPEGYMCAVNPACPELSDYGYYVTDLDKAHAKFYVFNNSGKSEYYSTFGGIYEFALSGDTVKFIGLVETVSVDSGDNKFHVNGGVTYDLNFHVIDVSSGAYAFYMGASDNTITMKNGVIHADSYSKLCEENSTCTLTVVAEDLTISDAIRESALSHIDNGVFVHKQNGFFTIEDSAPDTFGAKIYRAESARKEYYFTDTKAIQSASSMIASGDHLFVNVYDEEACITLMETYDYVTITKATNVEDFPEVKAAEGVIETTNVDDNTKTFTAKPGPVCSVNGDSYDSIAKGFVALKSSMGQTKTLTLLTDVTVNGITIDSNGTISSNSEDSWGIKINDYWTSAGTYEIDFNGHTITGGENAVQVIWITKFGGNSAENKGILNLKDSKGGGGIIGGGAGTYSAMISVDRNSTSGKYEVYVTGGKYINGLNQNIFNFKNNSVVRVTGGTYSKAPTSSYIAAGYQVKDNGDGTYSVIKTTN